jgi:hypothetical protein
MDKHGDDPAVRALEELDRRVSGTICELRAAQTRVEQLLQQRIEGWAWYDIVRNETPPLVVETITRALDDLGTVGGKFRREEAIALQREGISTNRIGELFGVTRQRVSALIKRRPAEQGREP